MSQATGISANFDFGEALKNAVTNLPPDPHPDFGFTVAVTKIRGDFTRGIVPPHLEVTVERPNGPTAAVQGQKPNDFTLQGKKKRIHYEATSINGRPLFSYQDEKDESHNRSFSGDEIDIRDTQFGALVTVMIEQVPDSHVVWFTLVVPTIYLPDGNKEFPIKTIAIFTTHQTPFVGPRGINGLQVDTYDTLALEGTARLAISWIPEVYSGVSGILLQFTATMRQGWSDTHLNRFHIHGTDFGVYHSGGMSFAADPEQVSGLTMGQVYPAWPIVALEQWLATCAKDSPEFSTVWADTPINE